MMCHPIFGEMDSAVRENKRRAEVAEFKKMMEALWQSRRITNYHRKARYVKPMSLGSDHGYKDEIYGE